MKYLVVILDGAAGWPVEELGGVTSLQRASTPNLDALAAEGTVGLARTIPEGEEPSSAAACMSILGYDPVADRVGRGAIEAAGMGIQLGADEIALRMNLVTIEDGKMRSYAGGHITTPEAAAIVQDLSEALGSDTVRMYPGVSYRHILVVKGHPELMDTSYTPPHDISGQVVEGHLPDGPGGQFLRDLIKRARPVLQGSGVNACRFDEGNLMITDIWPFWPGATPPGLVPFSEAREASAAMTSGVDLLNGLAALTGMTRLDIPGVTDGPDNDYAAQAEGALEALADHDVVVVHVESPDEAGHSGDVDGKVAAIEAIDALIIERLRRQEGDVRILAMPDHSTPIAVRTHVGDPVPFVLAGPGVAHTGATEFDEVAARATGLLVDPGRGVMDLLLG